MLALTSKPNMKNYNASFRDSKFDTPGTPFAEKTLIEYRLLTSGDMEKTIRLARYAEALRGGMVQLCNSDMKINLPAPLHLAERMEEYIWVPTQS